MYKRILKWLVTAAFVCAPLNALAKDTSEEDREKARDLFVVGKAHFQEERYEEAMKAFTESYNLSSEPNLLYNLGTTAERLGDTERAIAYYELYLEELPEAPDAEQVKMRVAALKAPPPPADTSPPEPAAEEKAVQALPEEPVSAEEYYNLDGDEEDDKIKVFWPGVFIGIGGFL